jgi:hypothetical protein
MYSTISIASSRSLHKDCVTTSHETRERQRARNKRGIESLHTAPIQNRIQLPAQSSSPAASAFVSSLVMALLFRLPNAVFPLRLLLSCCSDSSPDSSYSSQFCFTLFSSIWILLWSSLVFSPRCSSLLPQDLDSLFAFLRIFSSLYCFFGFFLLFLAAKLLWTSSLCNLLSILTRSLLLHSVPLASLALLSPLIYSSLSSLFALARR